MTDRDAPGATVPPRDPVIRFRLHRGSLAASMETMRTFRSRVEFLHALREEMGLWASSSDEEFARNLGFVLYGDGPDTRIGWERTYLVTLSGSPIGFADGVPGDLPETSQPPGPAGTPCPTCGRDDVFMKGDSWWCSNCGKARPSPSDQARAERRRAAAPVEAPPILSRPEIQLPTDLQRTPDQEAFLRGARDAEGTTPEGRVVKKALDRMWDAPPIEHPGPWRLAFDDARPDTGMILYDANGVPMMEIRSIPGARDVPAIVRVLTVEASEMEALLRKSALARHGLGHVAEHWYDEVRALLARIDSAGKTGR